MFRHRKKKGQQLEIEEHEELMTFRGEFTGLLKNNKHKSITPSAYHRTENVKDPLSTQAKISIHCVNNINISSKGWHLSVEHFQQWEMSNLKRLKSWRWKANSITLHSVSILQVSTEYVLHVPDTIGTGL